MLHLLLAPSNRVCDAFGVEDEHERGMIRQLVNALLLSAMVVPLFWLAWVLAA